MQGRWSVYTAYVPGASLMLGQQLLLLFHAVALFLLSVQPLPLLPGAPGGPTGGAPIGQHWQQQGPLPHQQQPEQPSPPSESLQHQQPGDDPYDPLGVDVARRLKHEAVLGRHPREGGTKVLPAAAEAAAAPPAAVAAAAAGVEASGPNQEIPKEGQRHLRPLKAPGPAAVPLIPLNARYHGDAGAGAPSEAPSGKPNTASGAPELAAAGVVLLAGGWGVALLLLLSPLGCLPYVRHCTTERHNRGAIGEGPFIGSRVLREGPLSVPSRAEGWGIPRLHGVYVPSLLTEVLPQCLLAVAGAPLVALLAWGEYGALSTFASGWGPRAASLGGPPGARLPAWAALYPPWPLSLSLVAVVLICFALLTAYPVSSVLLWGAFAGVLGGLGGPSLVWGHERVEAHNALRALPPPLLPAAAAVSLAASLCCFRWAKGLLGYLTGTVS